MPAIIKTQPNQRISPNSSRENHSYSAALAFLIPALLAGTVYCLTAAPSSTWRFGGEDGVDLVSAVVLGGAPHPTGYPLYLLLGRLFLPLSADPARALNLASACWGAVGCGLVGLAAARYYRMLLDISHKFATTGGITVGLALAFAPLIWSQAIITEVYSLNLALTGLFLLAIARWQEKAPGSMVFVALSGGLATSHHRTALFTVIASLLFMGYSSKIWLTFPSLLVSFKFILRTVALFLIGFFVPFLYFLVLPESVHAPNWYAPGIGNLSGFWKLFSASDYQPYVMNVPLQLIPAQLSASVGFLIKQFGWIGLILGWYGFTVLWQRTRSRPFALFLTVGFGIHLCFAISYNAVNSEIYLIPAFVMWAIAGGFGLLALLQHLIEGLARWKGIRRKGLYIVGITSVLVLILIGTAINYSTMDLSGDTGAVLWLDRQLQQAPLNAILVSSDDSSTFTLWYGLYVLKRRPDLAVVDSRLLDTEWYRISLQKFYPELVLSSYGQAVLDPQKAVQVLAAINKPRPVILTF